MGQDVAKRRPSSPDSRQLRNQRTFSSTSFMRTATSKVVRGVGQLTSNSKTKDRRKRSLASAGGSFEEDLKSENSGTKAKRNGLKWLEEQRKKVLEKDDFTPGLLQLQFQKVFKEFSSKGAVSSSGRLEKRYQVTKPQFISTCRNLWGDEIDSFLFMKLFDFMDCDSKGFVDDLEFSIISSVLLQKGSEYSNVEIAYQLFDTDKSGELSQSEFSEMLAAIVGTSLDNLMSISVFKTVFIEFVKSQEMFESLSFILEIYPYFAMFSDGEKIFMDFPVSFALDIVERFILDESELVINVSSAVRGEVLREIYAARDAGKKKINAEVFQKCYDEIVYLMESNFFPLFKDMLRKKPYSSITSSVWTRFGLGADDSLSLENFALWANEIPHLFDFFTKMQNEFSGLIDSLYSNTLLQHDDSV